MKRLLSVLGIVFGICQTIAGQQPAQTIRGVVTDQASQFPVAYANVILLHTDPVVGTITDMDGNFALPDIPVGRYDVQVSAMGYEPSIIREVQVSSAKETYLTVQLKESAIALDEVALTPNVNKEQPLNGMATASARMLSVDEASRYAGGFDDPARLAASFAGVSSNIANNGIAIRGNAPKFLQWKMEGIEIPNPNHFADLSAFGGGGLTALSTQALANSDFFTGAFPAEYGNGLSGVFDIFMRNGNNQRHERAFQAGITGLEAFSEGPLGRAHRSSYLVNYRYATLGLIASLLPENAGGVSYQDLSYKIQVPTEKAGVFSVWGIGLTDRSGQEAERNPARWFYDSDREDQTVKQYMGATGINHTCFFSEKTYVKTSLATTVNGIDLNTKRLDDELAFQPENTINNRDWRFVFASFVNTKFSAKHTNKTGIALTGMCYDLLLREVSPDDGMLRTIADESGFSSLLSAYTSSAVNFSDKLTLTLGVNSQLFTLNNRYTIEPRLGIQWQFAPSQSAGVAYGLHSRIERLNYYFTRDAEDGRQYNKDLDFTKAHHIVLSYDANLAEQLRLKVEPYFQYLFRVPVVDGSSFSFLNLQDDWFFREKLVNNGKGINYGVDITLEQYLTRGLYFLLTGSVFNSRYRGGDEIWRDTQYNRKYLFNFLAGKEWMTGKNRQNVLGLNVRLSYQGGDPYSPLDEAASFAAKEAVQDETRAFSSRFPAAFTSHLTFTYRLNRVNKAHEFALKVINTTGYKEFSGFQYNLIHNRVDERREAIFIPNLSYRFEF